MKSVQYEIREINADGDIIDTVACFDGRGAAARAKAAVANGHEYHHDDAAAWVLERVVVTGDPIDGVRDMDYTTVASGGDANALAACEGTA